jgi:hypothetical protein
MPAPPLGLLVRILFDLRYQCLMWSGSCSCGFGEPLHLLEQPGSARRLVGGWRRRPLRRRLDGHHLLRLGHNCNVKISPSPLFFLLLKRQSNLSHSGLVKETLVLDYFF